MKCPTCNFWKLNETKDYKRCKKCGYTWKRLDRLISKKTIKRFFN